MGHSLSLRYSDDGGRNFARWKEREKGVTGAFLTELKWDRLGETRAREWEICDASNVAADILAAALMIEPSTSWADFPLPDGSYSDATREFTQQDVVNFLPTFAEGPGTRSRAKYTPAPGLQTFCTVGTGPHRGGRDVEGKCFVVSGSTLYQIATDGTATSIGTIPGTGLVSMTHNQIANGNQLLIGTGDNSYVYNTVTGALTANGIPLLSVDFLNQLNLGVDQARRFWRYSGLADATSWNTLDNESAESSPDRIVGGIVAQGEWLVFGERTIEPWGNDPTATNSTEFQRNTGAISERGCINANTIKRLDNSVFFIDNNFIPCRLNGYQPVPIAPKAIVDALSQSDPAKLLAYTWEDKGYVVYYVTAQDGQTFGYDCTSQKWHRRESFGLDRWRLNTLFKWNGDWYGGDAFNGKFYRLTWLNVYEGCDLMPRRIRTGVLHSNGNKLRVSGAKLLVQTGGAESTIPAVTVAGTLPDGHVGQVVSYLYTALGGGGDIAFAIASGALPTGLSMSSSGLVTGTLTTAGTFSWVVSATAACGDPGALSESAVIDPQTYMAVGASGKIYTTTSLSGTWTSRTSGTSFELRAVTQGVTNSIAVGGTAGTQVLLYSADRVTWNAATNVGSGSYYGVAASPTSVVAVTCPGGTADGGIIRSTNDGASYTSVTIPSGAGPLTGICYAAGKYVACSNTGKILVSADDGVTWTKYTAGTDFLAVTYNTAGSEWMLVGNHAETATAADPTGTWTARSAIGGSSFSFLAVAPGLAAGHYLAGANGGAVYAGIYTTSDHGATWTRSGATTENLNGFTHIGADLIGLSTFSSVWVSQNETTWSEYTVVNGFSMNAMFAKYA